jgi:hypothetical protein
VTFDLDDDDERDTAFERTSLLDRADVLDANELPPDERTPELRIPLPAA